MIFDYVSSSFLSTPVSIDKRIRIYDKEHNLKYSIEPDVSYYYVSNNCLVIKITNKNDIVLSFENKDDALLAISRFKNVLESIESMYRHTDIEGGYIYSLSNMNMDGADMIFGQNGDKACNIPILEDPKSTVRVLVNGVEVNVGSPSSDNTVVCFFAPDGLSGTDAANNARERGQEHQGDYLYWIGDNSWEGTYGVSGAGYWISNRDDIDFIYLVKK